MSDLFTKLPEVEQTLVHLKEQKVDADLEHAKMVLNTYFHPAYGFPMDLSVIPPNVRMALVQRTPKKYIKTREVAKMSIPYITHEYAEKALNFISNFEWSSRCIREPQWIGGTKSIEVIVEMEFCIKIGEVAITRYIASGHRMYENRATTRADCLKSAISKANTVFARQLGIGANITDIEGKAYKKLHAVMLKEEMLKMKSNPEARSENNAGITLKQKEE